VHITNAYVVNSVAHGLRAIEVAASNDEIALTAPQLVPLLDATTNPLLVAPLVELEGLLTDAEDVLRDAARSGNGSVRDAHVLALAWCSGADTWSFDRDLPAQESQASRVTWPANPREP
jgi:hypothetical protein